MLNHVIIIHVVEERKYKTRVGKKINNKLES